MTPRQLRDAANRPWEGLEPGDEVTTPDGQPLGTVTSVTCPHTGEWKTWPDVITAEDLRTGNHGTICVACGKQLTLEETMAVYLNE